MLWQTVDKVEVKIREELWEVMSDHKHHSEGGFIELLETCWYLLPWDHVILEEGKQVDDEFFEFEPLLVESVVLVLGTGQLRLVACGRGVSTTTVLVLRRG